MCIYKIFFKGKIDENVEINVNKIENKYNIYEIINNTFCDYDIKQLLAENESNLLGRFIKAMEVNGEEEDLIIRKKALQYGIEALLLAGDE